MKVKVSAARGAQGFKGDPGGSPFAPFLFTQALGVAIPTGTDMVRTIGFAVPGWGQADYAYDAAVTSAYVAANPYTSFRTSNGRGFRLASPFPDSNMVGMRGDYVDATGAGNDASARLQALIRYAVGKPCLIAVGPNGGNHLLLSQIKLPSRTCLSFGPGVKVWRGWSTADAARTKKDATFINDSHPAMELFWAPATDTSGGYYRWEDQAVDRDITILGPGGFDVTAAARAACVADPANPRYAGPHLSIVGAYDVHVEGTTSEATAREWGYHFIASRGVFSKNSMLNGKLIFTDGLHIVGGEYWRIDGNHMESGDDCYAFGAGYNLPLRHVRGTGNTGISNDGYLFRPVAARKGVTADFATPITNRVEDIEFEVSGRGGVLRNGLFFIESDAAPTLKSDGVTYRTSGPVDSVRDITLWINGQQGNYYGANGSRIDNGDGTFKDSQGNPLHGGVNAQAGVFFGGKSIKVYGSIANPIREAVIGRYGADDITVAVECEAPQIVTSAAMTLMNVGHWRINPGREVVNAAQRSGIDITDSGLIEVGPDVRGLVTGRQAVRVVSGTCELRTIGLRATKVAGATGTGMVRIENGATAALHLGDDDASGVDIRVQQVATGQITEYSSHTGKGTRKAMTVSAAAATWQGQSRAILYGGAGGNLSTVSLVPDGLSLGVMGGDGAYTLVASTNANGLDIGANKQVSTTRMAMLTSLAGALRAAA